MHPSPVQGFLILVASLASVLAFMCQMACADAASRKDESDARLYSMMLWVGFTADALSAGVLGGMLRVAGLLSLGCGLVYAAAKTLVARLMASESHTIPTLNDEQDEKIAEEVDRKLRAVEEFADRGGMHLGCGFLLACALMNLAGQIAVILIVNHWLHR